MAVISITSPSGLGEETAGSVEDPIGPRRTSSVRTLGPPAAVGQSVAEVGVEVVTRPLQL